MDYASLCGRLPVMSSDGAVEINGYLLLAEQVPLWQRAMALARGGDLVPAVNVIQEVVARQPEFLPARIQMAYFMLSVDRYRDARRIALHAVEGLLPRRAIVLELIRLLRRFEEHELISSLVDRMDWTAIGSADFLLAAAAELGPIGLYAQAEQLLDRAEAIAPAHPRLSTLRGTVLLMSGDGNAAKQSFRKALDSPGAVLPHVRWMLSLQPDKTDLDKQVLEVQETFGKVLPGSEDEAYLWYALHNVHHAAGRYEEAWSALERGSKIKRSLGDYSLAQQRSLFDRLKQVKPASPFATSTETHDGPRVIFIVGMHRSGTSIVERILSGHSDVADGGESYVFTAAMREATDHFSKDIVDEAIVVRAANAKWTLVGEQFRAYARWRANGRRWFTEKLPSNFLNLGFILQALPDALVLHMRRDPIDTCFSNLRTFFSQAAPYSYDQSELADYFLRYSDLMQHWHAQYPGRILDVNYGEFVDDPETHSKRIMAFCGLEYEAEALNVQKSGGFTATASVASVRQGILKDRGGAWINYRSHLQPLLLGLGRTDHG